MIHLQHPTGGDAHKHKRTGDTHNGGI
jgi:hypothetical protein